MEINEKKNQPPPLPARKSKHSIGNQQEGLANHNNNDSASKKNPPPLPPRKIRNKNEIAMNRNSKRRSSKRRSSTSSSSQRRVSKGIHIAVTASIASSVSSSSTSDAIDLVSQYSTKNENQLVSTPMVEKKHPVLRIADAELAMMAMEDPMTPSQLESSFQDNVSGTPNIQHQQSSSQAPAINLNETMNANSISTANTTGSWWKSASSNEKLSFAKWVGDKLSKRHDIPKIVKASFWMQQKSQTSKILLTPEPVVDMKLFETVSIDNDMSENIPDNQLSSVTATPGSASKLERKLSKKLSDNGLGRSPKLSGAQKQILIESLGYSSKQIKIVSPHTPIDAGASNLGEKVARRQATPVLLQANFRELSIHDSSTPNKLKD